MESVFSGLLDVKSQRTKQKRKEIHLHLREEMDVTGAFFGVRTYYALTSRKCVLLWWRFLEFFGCMDSTGLDTAGLTLDRIG